MVTWRFAMSPNADRNFRYQPKSAVTLLADDGYAWLICGDLCGAKFA
jgi:hypothetical protein